MADGADCIYHSTDFIAYIPIGNEDAARRERAPCIYSSEMKMQQGASERRVYKREAHTQVTSNDAASSFPMSIAAAAFSQGGATPRSAYTSDEQRCCIFISDEYICR